MENAREEVAAVETEEELMIAAPQPHERVFYWGSGSPQAWRILIALEEKQIPYRSVCISFSSGVLKTPFFKSLNPRMRIPTLVEPLDDATDDTSRVTIYESTAILEYLEKKFPSLPCMPSTLSDFAQAQTRLHEANEILSIVGDLVAFLRRFPPEKRPPEVLQAKWSALESELSLWESYLRPSGYLIEGETPYLCDFVVFTNVAYAVRCGLQLDGLYPRLATFYTRLCDRASVEKTWPPHWRSTCGSKVLFKCFYCSDKPRCCCCPSTEKEKENASQ